MAKRMLRFDPIETARLGYRRSQRSWRLASMRAGLGLNKLPEDESDGYRVSITKGQYIAVENARFRGVLRGH
jgi:hypothetical protein